MHDPRRLFETVMVKAQSEGEAAWSLSIGQWKGYDGLTSSFLASLCVVLYIEFR